MARSDRKPVPSRKRCNDVLRQSISKMLLVGIATHVDEGQHSDGRFVGQSEPTPRRRRSLKGLSGTGGPDAKDTDRLSNVLDLPLSHVFEVEGQLAHLAVRIAGEADALGLGQGFETHGDVYAVAVDVPLLADDVADVDADPKGYALLLPYVLLALGDPPLDCDRALYRVDGARELDQGAVAHQLDDSAVVRGDRRFDEILPQGFQTRVRPRLVGGHEARVPHNIGSENGRQPAFGSNFIHLGRPSESVEAGEDKALRGAGQQRSYWSVAVPMNKHSQRRDQNALGLLLPHWSTRPSLGASLIFRLARCAMNSPTLSW
jgi:hypothetical protein